MRDLEYVSQFIVEKSPHLTSISLPKASWIDEIDISGVDQITLDFPSLLNVSVLALQGNFSSLLFLSLANIQTSFTIADDNVFDHSTGFQAANISYEPLDISFPSLKTASQVDLSGNISRSANLLLAPTYLTQSIVSQCPC